jgi:serine/threonine-protein kinase
MKPTDFNPDYLLPGTRIGAYVVRTQIGQGGGSSVYEVESPDGNLLALKICRYKPGPPGSLEWRMDRRQSRSIVCLENLRGVRNVAQILAHDRFPDVLRGHQYVVQELVPGGLTITDWVERRAPTLVELVTAFLQLAELFGELAYADIRHRDLKPSNILMTPDGIPKIVDFDSAICFRAEPLTREAASAQPGSHGYICPELCLAVLAEDRTGRRQPFDFLPWSDLHGLGVVLYEALTGLHPFNLALQGYQLLEHIAHQQPVHPMRVNEAIPLGLNKVVMKLLMKNPLERYQHGDRVAEDLRALLENASDESWTKPFRWEGASEKPPRRHEMALAVQVVEALTRRDSPVAERPLPALAPTEPVVSPRADTLRLWRPAALAAVLLVAVAGWLLAREVSWPLPSPPPAVPAFGAAITSVTSVPEKGAIVASPAVQPSSRPPVPKRISTKARKAAAVAVTTLAAACTGCSGVKVRPEDDLAWLASCPPEARETVRILGIYPGEPNEEGPAVALLQKGPNVIPHRLGCEVREGHVEAVVAMSPGSASGRLIGTAREGSDYVSFRFHELRVGVGAEFRKYPICALGADSFLAWGPGVAKGTEGGLPASELTPGYSYITTGRLMIRVAPYIPNRSQGDAKVN